MQQHRFELSILHALPSSSPPPIAFQQITSPALLPRSTFSPHRPSPPCCYRVRLSFSIARVFSASTHFFSLCHLKFLRRAFVVCTPTRCFCPQQFYPDQIFLFLAVLPRPDLFYSWHKRLEMGETAMLFAKIHHSGLVYVENRNLWGQSRIWILSRRDT